MNAIVTIRHTKTKWNRTNVKSHFLLFGWFCVCQENEEWQILQTCYFPCCLLMPSLCCHFHYHYHRYFVSKLAIVQRTTNEFGGNESSEPDYFLCWTTLKTQRVSTKEYAGCSFKIRVYLHYVLSFFLFFPKWLNKVDICASRQCAACILNVHKHFFLSYNHYEETSDNKHNDTYTHRDIAQVQIIAIITAPHFPN